MIETHLPILIVVVPLLCAIVTPMISRRTGSWAIAQVATAVTFTVAVRLLSRVLASPTGFVSYAIGNWPPPWGIEYRVDAVNGFVVVVVAAIAMVVTFYARVSVEKEIPADRHHFFYAVWLLGITGLLGITVTGDAFNVYVLLEISSLATYTLVAMGRTLDRKALPAAMNYLVIGTIGASFILLGIGYLYMVTGTLNMQDMAQRLPAAWDSRSSVITVALAFLIIGFAIKLALFPLHFWLPNAYTFSPSAVSALLAATATKVGAYVTIRFLFTVIGIKLSFEILDSGNFLMILSLLAIVAGSWMAIRQTNAKRLLAYSSVAQVGYIVLGVALLQPDGLAGSLIHIFNHALTKGGMFLAMGAVVYRLNGCDISDLAGLGRKMPLTMAALVAGGLGLIGVPLTAGFVSKWYLVRGAFAAGQPFAAFIVLVGSLMAVVYVWKLVEVIYFKAPATTTRTEPVKEAPWPLVVATWMLIGASIYFGINATVTGSIAETAAKTLLVGVGQ